MEQFVLSFRYRKEELVPNYFIASNIDHPNSKPRYIALDNNNKYNYSCFIFQREDLLCRHIFKLIKPLIKSSNKTTQGILHIIFRNLFLNKSILSLTLFEVHFITNSSFFRAIFGKIEYYGI